MRKFITRHRQLLIGTLPYSATVLLAAAFLWYAASWLVLVGLVPYIAYVWAYARQSGKISRRAFLTNTWLMGFFFCLLAIGWFIATDTSAWTHLGNFPLRATVFAIWFVFGLALSLGFWLLGIGIAWLSKRIRPELLVTGALPVLWLVSEFARSWLFSLISYGHGGSLGPYWNFGSLGFAAAATPMAYAARMLGLYGLSGAVVLVNAGVFWLLLRRWRWAAGILGGVAVLAALGYGLYAHAPGRHITVATVQLPSDDTDYYDQLNRLAADLPHAAPSLLAMPEYSYYFDYVSASQAEAMRAAVFDGQPGLLTYSRKDYFPGAAPFNQVVYMTDTGATVSAQRKSFLIPTGEYLPAAITAAFRLSGHRDILTSFTGDIAVSRATVREVPVQFHGVRYSALACSAVIAPQLYRRAVGKGAQVLVNDASLNEFREAIIYHQQARQFARFIAIATDRPFVQSARGGYSYVLDRDGHFLYSSPRNGVQLGMAAVTAGSRPTLYDLFGDWVVYVSIAGISAVVFLTSIRSYSILQSKSAKHSPKKNNAANEKTPTQK